MSIQTDRLDRQNAYKVYLRQNLHNDCTADAFDGGWNAAIEYIKFCEVAQKEKDRLGDYVDRALCIKDHKHMVSCDDHGFCTNCGWKSLTANKDEWKDNRIFLRTPSDTNSQAHLKTLIAEQTDYYESFGDTLVHKDLCHD